MRNYSTYSIMGRLVVISVLVLALPLSSCTTMRSAGRQPEAVADRVHVGDEVLIHTKDKSWYQFVVTQLTNTSIQGEHNEILFEDIASVEVKEFDSVKTASNVVATGTLIALFAILLIPGLLFAGF